MGYHFEDFFNDHVFDLLKKLISFDTDGRAEEFIRIIKQAIITDHHGEMLSKRLLQIISEKDGQDSPPPDDAFYNLFTQLYPNYDIRKLEYAKDDGTLVNIDYHGADDKI